jgi:hypothetical protein
MVNRDFSRTTNERTGAGHLRADFFGVFHSVAEPMQGHAFTEGKTTPFDLHTKIAA